MSIGAQRNIISVILKHAKERPENKCITFIKNDSAYSSYSYKELPEYIFKIAANLREKYSPGERVILAIAPNEFFVFSFLGCLVANIIPVPCYLPLNDSLLARFLAITEDCNAKGIILDSNTYRLLKIMKCAHFLNTKFGINTSNHVDKRIPLKYNGQLLNYQFENIKQLCKKKRIETNVNINPEKIAFLQYTSGTTDRVKGVCVTHQNILENLSLIHKQFNCSHDDIGYIWLPLYHDMGLIGGVLETLYGGFHTYFSSPVDFVKSPVSWLNGISKYKATISGGPNFAFSLLSKISDKKIPGGFDLSSWRVAFCGAEPIQAETLKAFSNKYKKHGFNESSLFPCYGLAEATLFVSGKYGTTNENTLHVDKYVLAHNKIKTIKHSNPNAYPIYSSGLVNDLEIKILDQASDNILDEGSIGRIVTTGKSITKGYWNNQDENEKLFLDLDFNGKKNRYIDTGDCGAIVNDNLYVLGRLKDLIIILGKNYHVGHIEQSLSHLSANIRKGCVAIVQDDDTQKVIAFLEIKVQPSVNDHQKLKKKIIEHTKQNHDLTINDIVFLKARQIPKTTSGKISRVKCLMLYKTNQFKTFEIPKTNSSRATIPGNNYSPENIKKILHDLSNSHPEASNISSSVSLLDSGYDSMEVINFCQKVNEHLGFECISALDLYNHPSIDKLSTHINDIIQQGRKSRLSSIPDTDLNKKLAPDIVPCGPLSSVQKNVLMTGATGFVGAHFLSKLLNKDNGIVWCLIRATDNHDAKKRLYSSLEKYQIQLPETIMRRIQCINGDCSLPTLGLSEQAYDALANDIDTVVHCAAEVDFLKNAQTLYASNVLAVEEIIRFSTHLKQKKLEYISTYSVTIGSPQNDYTQEITSPPSVPLGYIQTKWLAERLCFQAIKRNIPLNIYRLGNIGGNTQTSNYNKSDMIFSLMKSFLQTGKIIDFKGKISIYPIDILVDDLEMLISMNQNHRCYNLVNPRAFSIKSIKYIALLLGIRLKRLSAEEWIEIQINHDNKENTSLRFIPLLKEKQYIESYLTFSTEKYEAIKSIGNLKINQISLVKSIQILKHYVSALQDKPV